MDTVYITDLTQLHHYMNSSEKPIFFTRRLPEKAPYDNCISIKSGFIQEQLMEIKDVIKPFVQINMLMSRCIICNAALSDVKKTEIEQFIPEYVFHHYDIFKICPVCKKVYWQGSHAEHMMVWIENFMAEKDHCL